VHLCRSLFSACLVCKVFKSIGGVTTLGRGCNPSGPLLLLIARISSNIIAKHTYQQTIRWTDNATASLKSTAKTPSLSYSHFPSIVPVLYTAADFPFFNVLSLMFSATELLLPCQMHLNEEWCWRGWLPFYRHLTNCAILCVFSASFVTQC
jgi:hypothetical protein